MTPTSPEENSILKEILLNRIRREGKISFCEFMDSCLYHPLHGYYQTEREKIGSRGDYYTSSSVHPVFGWLLARQLHEMAAVLGGEGGLWIIEAGAGKGILAMDILDRLAEEFPGFFDTVRYGILEKSPGFVKEQKRRLVSHEGRVAWLDLEQIEDGALVGCVVANEFIDAFPVHRVLFKGGKLREIYVSEKGGAFCEILDDPCTEDIARYFENMEVRLEEGQHAEVNLDAMRWYDELARVLCRGFLLIIDYGYLAGDLYDSDRRSGSLLCYSRHTVSENPYDHIGCQDMTAHVNFTGLMKKGRSLGFRVTGFVPQYRFLLSLGFLDELERQTGRNRSPDDALQQGLAMKRLILPDGGMGDTFKVLIQHKGVMDFQLRGLQEL